MIILFALPYLGIRFVLFITSCIILLLLSFETKDIHSFLLGLFYADFIMYTMNILPPGRGVFTHVDEY